MSSSIVGNKRKSNRKINLFFSEFNHKVNEIPRLSNETENRGHYIIYKGIYKVYHQHPLNAFTAILLLKFRMFSTIQKDSMW